MGAKSGNLNSVIENQDFGFEFASGFVAHNDTPRTSHVQFGKTDVATICLIAKESRDRKFALQAATV
jgi:hypothetical protein